jgi:hypothetical protein
MLLMLVLRIVTTHCASETLIISSILDPGERLTIVKLESVAVRDRDHVLQELSLTKPSQSFKPLHRQPYTPKVP